MFRRSLAFWPVLVVGLVAGPGLAQDILPPRSVKVLPVFFVPKGEDPPTDEQTKRLMKHLEWARARYKELLRDRDTFAVAEEKPRVYKSGRVLAFYHGQADGAAPHLVDELLTEWKLTRFNCPYVLLVVVMNPKDEFPVGGGRPLNGGINTGGGVVQLSTFAMDKMPNFHSTLRHELGHSFGLPHVDVYGYDMKTNASLMSYNPKHHTKGFTPGDTPGVLIPEDLRALALNRRVFPKLKFDPAADVPADYPTVAFDPATTWQSAKTKTGWVSVEVTFPSEVELSHVGVHSQHSGEYNAARAVRVAVAGANDRFRQITSVALKSPDEKVPLPKAKSRVWRFEFQPGASQCVTLRGLRFYSGVAEVFPPLVPSHP